MDFSNYVRSLLHAGRAAEARTLWESVVEVIHNGTNPNEAWRMPQLIGLYLELLYWPFLLETMVPRNRDTHLPTSKIGWDLGIFPERVLMRGG
jgi:hypothetical protein